MNTPSGAAERPRDPGLQGERTALAWGRTALAMSVNALLTLRSGWTSGEVLIVAVGIALLLAAGACALCGGWRRRSLLREVQASSPPASIILCVTLFAFVACAGAVASVVLSQPPPTQYHP